MDNLDLSSLVPDFKKSSENFMHDYTTTMKTKEITTDEPLLTETGFIIVLVIACIFMAVIIFWIIKSYRDRRREAEVRGTWRMAETRTPSLTPSENEGRFFHGDYIQLRQIIVEHRNEAEQGETESSTSLNLQRNEETISLPESNDRSFIHTYVIKQGTEYCPALHGKHENTKNLYSEFSKGSPASLSTPRESREGLLLTTKSEGIAYEISIGKQVPESNKNIEDKLGEVNVALSEHAARKSTPLPESGSQSSPTSPNPVRRRFPSSEDFIRQRPSSLM